ncbi:hypothetical protein NC651_006873 [Populus alba x Populus x berolinensis]|nr:hypothetical protein NC651_006873 [Populus alba x Populus x berolinensis]
MATEKADVEVSDTNDDNIQNTSTQTSVNSETPTSAVPRFGKALAHRALYGSSSRHGGSRKARSSDVKTLPSRLSKVSSITSVKEPRPPNPFQGKTICGHTCPFSSLHESNTENQNPPVLCISSIHKCIQHRKTISVPSLHSNRFAAAMVDKANAWQSTSSSIQHGIPFCIRQ